MAATWRNPYPRHIVTSPANPTHGEAATFHAGYFWCNVCPVPHQSALRIRAGAREACRRLRQERDAAVAQRDEERAEIEVLWGFLARRDASLVQARSLLLDLKARIEKVAI